MSWQKRSIRLVISLPFALPIIAYAVNIGDTYVQSQQNQPLNASINVTDIDPATFSVKVANPEVYQQLGLSKNADINVQFKPTSSNGGQITLTTTTPVAAPFTDVVLDISNKGESKTLPKTLLMPIDSSQQIITQNANTSTFVELEPATVNVGTNTNVDLPTAGEPYVQITEPVDTPVLTGNSEVPTTSASPTLAQVSNSTTTDKSANLFIEETLSFPTGNGITTVPMNGTATNPTAPVGETIAENNTAYTPNTPDTSPEGTSSDTPEVKTSKVVYVVQRNDNLWTIANQLAKKNKKDVDTVMKEIVAANPSSFVNNDPTKLIANTKLAIPAYEVIPSQLGIKAANTARKTTMTASKARAKPSTGKTTAKAKTNSKPAVNVARRGKSSNTTAKKVNRRAEMTIIAPSANSGSGQGTAQKSAIENAKTSGSGSSKSPVVAQVQQTRQATAQKAQRVGNLSQTLASAESKLKIQNAKLENLEKRLKELKSK